MPPFFTGGARDERALDPRLSAYGRLSSGSGGPRGSTNQSCALGGPEALKPGRKPPKIDDFSAVDGGGAPRDLPLAAPA